jgi:hypothetical protein
VLTRNIDTGDGLVNRAFGTVSGFDLDTSRQVKKLYMSNLIIRKSARKI